MQIREVRRTSRQSYQHFRKCKKNAKIPKTYQNCFKSILFHESTTKNMSSSSEAGDDIFASEKILQKQLDIAGQPNISFPKSKKVCLFFTQLDFLCKNLQTQKSPKITIRRRHSSTFITPPDGPAERRQARLIKQYKIDLINSDKAVNRRIAVGFPLFCQR